MVARKKTASKTVQKRVTAAAKKPTAKSKSKAVANEKATITIDRRGKTNRRLDVDRRTKKEPVNVERRVVQRRVKVNRRRQIDPTTCERDYKSEEIEFMSAMDNYKRSSGRMFPTCSEVLEVIKSLGYEKPAKPQPETEPDHLPEPHALPSIEMPNVATQSPTVIG